MTGMLWRVDSRGCLRIGHGGASALAPANTLASFDAALAVGIDMVEFDVRARRGRLILAHTVLDARRGAPLELARALAHLADPRFADVALNLDVKHTGAESALLRALAEAGLGDRALISSQVAAVLDRVREREPRVATGISVGGRIARASRRWRDWRAEVLGGLERRRWDALMVRHDLIDSELVTAVEHRRGALYAWTVNEAERIAALRRLGVHGITTADPRLFGT